MYIVLCALSIVLLFSTAVAGKPTAISVPVATEFLGYDGNWSPVSIRVGSPPQWVDVLVSTRNQETWVVGPGGCDGTVICRTKRGGLFQRNESSTWHDQGYYNLGLDLQLGFTGNGDYGLDTISLDEQVSVPSQIIGVINSTDYWNGFLGLGVEPTNFTTVNQLTFLSSMVENQSLIPSHSYGYTAGAYYRGKTVPSSLTVGGYDQNRFIPHDISFELNPAQDPVVALNSISVTATPLPASNKSTDWSTNPLPLFASFGTADVGLYTIDSSTSYLWLPETVCENFESALGLTYDDELQLYTFGPNATQHDVLVNWNMTFKFIIADLPGSTKTVTISLPYAAFDLQLSYPFPGLNATASSTATNYFPLRKAANGTQYTIGRAFLQESYLMVDYERNNFSVYQAVFDNNALNNVNLVDISRPRNSTFTGPKLEGSTLGKPTLIGIIIGAVVLLATILALWFYCLRGRKFRNVGRELGGKRRGKFSKKRGFVVEIGGSTQFATEMPGGQEVVELPGAPPIELQGSPVEVSVYGAAYHESSNELPTRMSYIGKGPVGLESRTIPPQVFELDYTPANCAKSPSEYSPDGLGPQGAVSSIRISTVSSQFPSPRPSPLTPDNKVSPIATTARMDGQIYRNDDRGVRSAEQGVDVRKWPTPSSYLTDSVEVRRSEGVQVNPRRFSWE
ncbi:Aspartic peptidase domain [Lasallia pustulata]|uniref:Aspartic peptidase domain n=1 Tax=Lasallia pustulata TaxID=136370 RepID=A0A1W5D0C6_9LECA|nr:Aspartic peptidase domain [Lasallia pustulata]